MTKTFTENDYTNYLYGGLEGSEKSEIDRQRSLDSKLNEEFEGLENLVQRLDSFQLEAPAHITDAILYTSRHLPTNR